MPPVKPTSAASLKGKPQQEVAPRAGENVVPKPTPTQEENDMAAAGVHVEVKEWDGTPLQNKPPYTTEPPDRPDRPDIPDKPVINSLLPNTAVVGGPDVTMLVTGSGFALGSVIVWNGGDEPTTYQSSSELMTVVKPSTASGPWTIPVAVRNGSIMSNEMSFTFTEA
jgi:IPT/TIG domain